MDDRYSVEINVTSQDAAAIEASNEVPWFAGRPSLSEEVQSLAPFGMRALVLACGPTSLVKELAALSVIAGVDFKSEPFEL